MRGRGKFYDSLKSRPGERFRTLSPASKHATLSVTTLGPGSIEADWRLRQIFAFRGGNSVALRLSEAPDLYLLLDRALAGFEKRPLEMRRHWTSVALTRMVAAISSAQHGGTIIVTNGTSDDPMLKFNPCYTFETPDQSLKDAVAARAAFARSNAECAAGEGDAMVACGDESRMQTDLSWREAAEYAAQLAAVDGAVVITSVLDILGFGVMIKPTPQAEHPRVARRNAMDTSATMEEVDFASVGGARHQSAVRWCAGHPHGGFAIVISQDGDVTFAASIDENSAWLLGPLYPPALE